MPPPNTRHSLPALPPSSLPRRSLGSNSCSAPSLASAAHAIGLTVVSISGSDPLPHPYGEGGGLCGGGDTTGMLRDRCGGDKQNGKSGGRSCSSAVCLGARPRPDTISVSGDGMGSGSGSGSGSGAARGAAIQTGVGTGRRGARRRRESQSSAEGKQTTYVANSTETPSDEVNSS